MDLWIYNKDFERLGVVDTMESTIWADRFRQAGDFEIMVPASDTMLQLLQPDRIVGRAGSDMLCFIEHVEKNSTEEDGDHLIVSGRCMRSILGRRIIWDQTVLTGTVENALRKIVTDALISPAIPERKYDKLILAPAHGYTETLQTQYTGDNVQVVVEELCAAYNYGYKITLQDGLLVLDFYKGMDRTAGQSKNPRVVFSEEYDNLAASNYMLDTKEYKTVALVAGEGEGTARRRTTVSRGVDQSGLHRREMFVDARDISSEEGAITEAAYLAQLAERGRPALSEAARIETMTGTIEDVQYIYGIDYNLGDTVTVRDKYGVQADSQVLEVVETWDENGYACEPTFG